MWVRLFTTLFSTALRLGSKVTICLGLKLFTQLLGLGITRRIDKNPIRIIQSSSFRVCLFPTLSHRAYDASFLVLTLFNSTSRRFHKRVFKHLSVNVKLLHIF